MKKSLLLYKSNKLIVEQLYFLPTIKLVCEAGIFKHIRNFSVSNPKVGERFMKCNIAVSSFEVVLVHIS